MTFDPWLLDPYFIPTRSAILYTLPYILEEQESF